MTIHVTRDQVDNAKLLMALDRADGRESEEWIVRLAGASTCLLYTSPSPRD